MSNERPIEPDHTRAVPNLRWHGGRNVAVVLSIAYETWQDGAVSGVGPMGNPLPAGTFDSNADSYGRYGAKAGIQRLIRKLDKAGVVADVLTSGALAERDPKQVKAIFDAGHGVIGHGYTQDLIAAKLSVAEDEESVGRTTRALKEATARQPTGWFCPRATPGSQTKTHLLKHGYRWQGDSLDSDLPYVETFKGQDLIALPFTVEFNDLSHSMRFGRTPQQFVDLFEDALRNLLADKDDTVLVDVLVHAHCYGRPAGAWAFAEIARKCKARDDIWLTSREHIADHFVSELNKLPRSDGQSTRRIVS